MTFCQNSIYEVDRRRDSIMLKFLPCALLVLTISLCHGRRLHKRQDSEPVVVAARPPPKPPATEAPPPVPPAPTVQPQVPEQQPVQPQVPLQPQPPQQPIAPLQGAVLGLSPEGTPVLLQAPQQPRLTQQQWRHLFSPPRNFAPGFEAKPIPEDASLNQPRVQWIGAEQQQPVDPAVLGANGKQVPLQQLNLGVIRPQEQQSAKSNQLRLSGIPPPDQQAPSDEELKQRILEQAIRSQVNTAGRDREAFLARINVTGNHDAAKEFVRQLKNLSDFQEKQPFASVDVMKGLINAEISLAVDNWILNEEIAGQMAATFGKTLDHGSCRTHT